MHRFSEQCSEAKVADKIISRKRCKIGAKLGLILFTHAKSHKSNFHFHRWPWMTLNGVMAVVLRRYFVLFRRIR